MAVVVLSGCGGVSAAGTGGAAESGGQAASSERPPPVWPDPARTLLIEASGPGTPLGEYEAHDIGVLAEQQGLDLQRALTVYVHQDDFGTFTEAVRHRFADRLAGASFTSSDGDPAWVAFTGEVPQEAVALAVGLPLDVELRGGALLTEEEQGRATSAAMDAFVDDLRTPLGGYGVLDAPTARLTIGYVPGGAKEPDAGTTAAIVAAARSAVGRDVPFTVEYVPDKTDPTDTQPATWFLPAGYVPDAAATSVEVLVQEQGCTGGRGAEGNTAEPVIEITDTEVRISVSTFVRRGPQTCPGHPLAPLVVDLGEQLGDRTLVDVNGTIDDHLAPQGGDLVVPQAPAS